MTHIRHWHFNARPFGRRPFAPAPPVSYRSILWVAA
jgi:hypothetical protein